MIDLRDLYLGRTQYQAVIATIAFCAEEVGKCRTVEEAEAALRKQIPLAVRRFHDEQEDRT